MKEYDKAISDLTKAIENNPANAWAFDNRAWVKELAGHYDEAIKDYDEAVKIDPKNGNIRANRGFTKVLSVDYAGAIVDFDEAIRLNPTNHYPYAKKAFLLSCCPSESIRDGKRALESAEEAIKLSPDSGTARAAKAFALAIHGDYEGAIAMQRIALQDEDYAKDENIDGGKFAMERITTWEQRRLWLFDPKP